MKNFINPILVSSILLINTSCNSVDVPPNVSAVIEQAGENGKELEKVLKNYSSKKDSLKYQSACYLIENMSLHKGQYYLGNKNYNDVFRIIGKFENSQVHKRLIWDTTAYYFEDFDYQLIVERKDIDYITSDFLIENIDKAFYAWEKYPWCKNLSFKDFKQYILPYRVNNEALESCRAEIQERYKWLTDSLMGYENPEDVFTIVYNHFYKYIESTPAVFYPIPMTYKQIEWAKGGRCEDICNYLVMIMRSLGIKCSYDYILSWANRNPSGHSWVAFIDSSDNTFIIDKDEIFRKAEFVHSSRFNLEPPGKEFIDEKIICYENKKAAKVWRFTYNSNKNSVFFNDNLTEKIIDGWDDRLSIDVSGSYMNTSNITLNLPQEINSQLCYLTVFGKESFGIEDIAIINNHNTNFKNLSKGIVYFPFVKDSNTITSVLNPFIVNENGDIEYFKPDLENLHDITISRKYPLFANIVNHANKLYGGKIQASNTEGFKKPIDLFQIDKTILIPTIIGINTNQDYQYYRYLPPLNTDGSIAELTFYLSINGKIKEASGKVIYKHEGRKNRTYQKAFDKDYSTYYSCKYNSAWLGIDLGNLGKVTKVKICPRTDTNFIIPGYEYELLYWDNGWISLGKKMATTYNINYSNVPKDALLTLKCHNGGNEERPFTYEKGKQVWW